MSTAQVVVRVEVAPTLEAARALLSDDARLRLRYRGVWAPPTAPQTLVHVFGDVTVDELELAGWTFTRHG